MTKDRNVHQQAAFNESHMIILRTEAKFLNFTEYFRMRSNTSVKCQDFGNDKSSHSKVTSIE